MTKRSRRSALGAASAAALGAATLAAPAAAAPTLDQGQVIVVAPDRTAAVADRADDGALVPNESHRKWALGLALGGLLGGIVGVFGFNALLNAMARGREAAGRLTRRLPRAEKRQQGEARVEGGIVSPPSRTAPGDALGLALGLGAAGLTGLALLVVLDLSWKAGLALGLVSALSTGVGALKLIGRQRPTPQGA